MRFIRSSVLAILLGLSAIPSALALDTIRPTLSITNPVANLRVSNDVFTVKGKAADNVAVSNVFYSLNGSDWDVATTANGWTNWSVDVNPAPGTNVVAAYAVDSSGNVSLTNTVRFLQVALTPLGVTLNGSGTVTPNYNNALLQVGQNYSMAAKAATGYRFTGWTGGAATTNATLKFTMISNLFFTANFMDVTKPTVAITNAPANLRVTNELFTLKGKAADNLAVDDVFYSLNGSPWIEAATANNWSNWTADLILTPGTNLLRAYAADTTANASLISTTRVVYVVMAPLTVVINGRGTLTPNYNGSSLQIGANYSMTAKAATGFSFGGWSGSSTTNGATLKFMMAAGLVFNANFTDITKPVNQILSPSANLRVSNVSWTITGKASDNVAVAGVFWSLNGSDWLPATTLNNWTNWSATTLLATGTNVLLAYAMDTTGLVSTTNRVNFVYVPIDYAPSSLLGLMADITPHHSSLFNVSFGTNTFNQNSPDRKNDTGVGSYAYTKLTTNTASLTLTYTSPPTVTNDGSTVFITFTTNRVGYFTNANNSGIDDIGKINLYPIPKIAPAKLAVSTIYLVSHEGEKLVATFNTSGQITLKNVSANTTVNGGFAVSQYSAIGALVKITNPAGYVNYVQVTFTGTNYGDYFMTAYPTSGSSAVVDYGTFILPDPTPKAPASLNGLQARVIQNESTFTMSFATNTFSQTSEDTNNNIGVGTYTYARPATASGQLTVAYTAPPTITNDTAGVYLTFIAANFALFTNATATVSNGFGTFCLSTVTNFVPASLAGKTIRTTNDNEVTDVMTFNDDGTFTQTETKSGNDDVSWGTYTFTKYSRDGAMLVLTFTGGVKIGSVDYFQTTFTQVDAGTYFITDYSLDPFASGGKFTIY